MASFAICAGLASVISGSSLLDAFVGNSHPKRETLKPRLHFPSARQTPATLRLAQESEVEHVRWLDPLDANVEEISPDEGATVLPVFPLGGPFMPYTKQSLQIFEPRYRQLYDNILLSGSRRFVATWFE